MGATFYPSAPDGRPVIRCICERAGTCPGCQLELDLAYGHVRELLAHLGFTPALYGQLPAAWIVSACERRLAIVDADEATPMVVRGRYIVPGRPAGYLRTRTEQLLAIARSAGSGWVSWG